VIHRLSVELNGTTADVTVEPLPDGRVRFTRGGQTRVFEARRVGRGTRASTWSMVAEGGGPQTIVDVDGAAPELVVTVRNLSVPVKVVDTRKQRVASIAARREAAGPVAVKSPMPGKVVKILVAAGDAVKAGQGVVVVEAMKMENELKSPRDGTISEVRAREGQAVEAGAELVRVAPPTEAAA
jgi:biotin carboxyl carrier protein